MFGLGAMEFIILGVTAVGGVAVVVALARSADRSSRRDAEWAAEARRRRERRDEDD